MFICKNCGYGSVSWIGKCPDCGEWNTLQKQEQKEEVFKKAKTTFKYEPLKKMSSSQGQRIRSGIYEVDRVLGDGFVKGAIILLTGEPGVGKSTLILQTLKNQRTLYISGEETGEQVKLRADRMGVDSDSLFFSENVEIESILEGFNEIKDKVDFIVIDSIQTLHSSYIDSNPGSVSQVNETIKKLIKLAKSLKKTVIVIGHITKEGDIAGPKALEHMVDVVINFEGEKVSQFRVLRASKNRFGPTDEIGIFEMNSEGLSEVKNPNIFIEENSQINIPGKTVIGILEGNRPLFLEIQALASPTILPVPRRVVKGVDYNKVLLLLAVIRKHLNLPLDTFDIYINVVGGINIRSTSADLGIVAAVISSIKNKALPKGSVLTGEVGLLGEIRKVGSEQRIIKEAKRLSFKPVFSSDSIKKIQELSQYFS